MTDKQESTRERISRSENAKARRTRDKLIAAFVELAAHDDEITVAKVVSRSGVNRTTFYSHYSSLEDLAVQALGDFFGVVSSIDARERELGRNAATSSRSLAGIAQFIGVRRTTYATLLDRNVFYAAVEDAFADLNRRFLEAAQKRDPSLSVDTDVVARFVAAGTLGVIVEWLRTGAHEDAATIAGRIAAVLPPFFTTDL